MSSALNSHPLTPIVSVNIRNPQDLVTARQRARQLSALLLFSQHDQTRIATAVSEIVRNAYQYAGGGCLDFLVDLRSRPQLLWMRVRDQGPGIKDVQAVLSGAYVSSSGMGIGLAGTSRVMDEFQIASTPREGTTVQFAKALPSGIRPIDISSIGQICAALVQQPTTDPSEEVQRLNRDLLQTLEALRLREAENERRREELSRLNLELQETNHGVVALYAELDDKAEALRRADEMKSRFLSHVSHEFRTPVNAVLALTRLLLLRVDGGLTPEQEKQVTYIRDAAAELAEMVNDLLDLAKVEAGKTEVRLTQIDVGQFLGAIRALMRPLVGNESVALIFEEQPADLVLESDEGKLSQILRNLVSNSLKFTTQGEVRVSAGIAGEFILFKVKDTGIGIAKEDQERIFQEFAQVENPIQTRVKGTGLGLPLSRKLAVLLGGTLTVESVLGEGSIFTLTLPYTTSSLERPTHKAEPAPVTGSKTILIVDDEVTARYLLGRLFQGTAHQLIEAEALEASERARFEQPALIILDLAMPGRSGFAVLDELKADPVTAAIPVVIHTSKTLTEADEARLKDKISVVLPKGPNGRLPALLAIRQILNEQNLFLSEPEFNQAMTADE